MLRQLPGTSRRSCRLVTRDDMPSDLPAANTDAGTSANATRISGYGAVFYNPSDAGTEYWLWDDIVERIMPGAFDRALREDDVRSFFNHESNFILGRSTANTLKLAIDAVGLRYEVQPSDSALSQHVLSAVGRGDVNGSSFMFDVGSATWVEEKQADGHVIWIREITEVAPLYEVGPVCFPAYEASTSEACSARSADSNANQAPNGPTANRWQEWYQRHVTQARASFGEYLRTRQPSPEDIARRQRARKRFELSHRT